MTSNSTLELHLSMTVPLRILELRELMQQGIGLTEHIARVSPYAHDIAECGDQILFRGSRTTELINKLVDAVAVLSFVPGGITMFGLHFESVV